ncbi:MAG TPA: hypothetical protein VHQ43_02135 [Solirubrobacterales bacterium]|nr:hypothetical protein [Solirubrobacterales bacterium]
MAAQQTKTVKLSASLVERAQQAADERGITLKQLVDDALERWLTSEERGALPSTHGGK